MIGDLTRFDKLKLPQLDTEAILPTPRSVSLPSFSLDEVNGGPYATMEPKLSKEDEDALLKVRNLFSLVSQL